MSIFRRKKKKQEAPLCAAVVAAAGNSTRMGEDKLLLPLDDEPVLLHTVRALELCELISEIVIVTRPDLILPVGKICQDGGCRKVSKIIRGGQTRTASVMMGVREVTCEPKLIAVHDGARPLVTEEVMETVIRQASVNGAAAPAIPLKDTIKLVADGLVEQTLDRTQLLAVQTPQVFDANLIYAALQKAIEDGAELTDDCSAVERMGMKVVLTRGSEENIKLTTPNDMILAQAILTGRAML